LTDWEGIVSRDGPAVWTTACRILGNRADAEECVQDAFAAAIAVSRSQPIGNWRALLQRLTTARAIDRLRQRTRRRTDRAPLDPELQPAAGIDPSQQAEDRELVGRLRKLIEELPAQCAELFVLHFVEGWTYQELAAAYSMSPGAVGMSLMRSRAKLRERMAHRAPKG
jgi:RNA polymerase sigma-70 factor (ECF subfamily)